MTGRSTKRMGQKGLQTLVIVVAAAAAAAAGLDGIWVCVCVCVCVGAKEMAWQNG